MKKPSTFETERQKLAQHFSSTNIDATKVRLGKGKTFKKYQDYALGLGSLKQIRDANKFFETGKTKTKRQQERHELLVENSRKQVLRQKLKEIFSEKNEGKILKIVDDKGRVSYKTVRKESMKTIADMLENGINQTQRIIRGDDNSDPEIYDAFFVTKFHPNNVSIEDPQAYWKSRDPKKHAEYMRQRKTGKFYKYYCKMNIDLNRYGILQSFDADYYENNCFYHALKASGMSEEKLQSLKYYMKDSHLSICNIKKVCEDLKVKIILHQKRRDNDKTVKTTYGENFSEKYDIGIYDSHYFVFDTTNITSFAIEHYDEIKDIKEWNKIEKFARGRYHKSNTRFIDSMSLFVKLDAKKDTLLEKIVIDDAIMSTPYYNRVEQKIGTLNYSENDYEAYAEKEKKNEKPSFLVFFDFETVTKGDNHKGYMVHYMAEHWNETNYVVGYDDLLGFRFLKFITRIVPQDKQLVLIAHNMRYDLSFISRFLKNVNTIKAGNSIICVTGKFFNHDIMIKDSYCMISMKLSQFNKSFKLGETKKEIINYDLYNDCIPNMSFETKDNDSHYLDIEVTANKYYSNSKNEFLKNIYEWNLVKGTTFNALEYAGKYCSMDVKTLKAGYETFGKWMKELYNIDVREKMTISGLADSVLKQKGCYDGCYSFAGVVRKFINQSVVGGRTMISNNSKKIRGDVHKIDFSAEDEIAELNKLDNTRISDFDGVSLYPSSMARIPGFIKGLPTVFDNTMSFNTLQSFSYYFVEIKITKMGTNRSFPLASQTNEGGVRIFNNEMVGKTIVVDKIALEDLKEFQKIDFDIIRGYYFNDGFNAKINEVITTMFNERLQKKKEKNPIQLLYKLIMNSAYGRTILKEQEYKEVYKNTKDEAFKYMLYNYNNVMECRKLDQDDKYVIKMRNEIQSHKNYCHIGAMVLSMSKRIMNEVMCTAEDNGIEIFYQDTDSMHLYENDITLLQQKYNEKYGRELIGEALGQFHTDFDMDGAKGAISSKLCIMLGKKCYIDLLKSDGADHYQCHIRLKGVPNSSILFTAKNLYGHKTEAMNAIHLYYDLFNGKKVNFDLTCEGNNPKFQMYDLLVRTRPEFNRSLQFK